MFGATIPRASRAEVLDQLGPDDERSRAQNLEQSARRGAARQDAERHAAGGAGQGNAGRVEASRPAEYGAAQEGLTAPTAADLQAKADRATAATKADAADQKLLADRAKADSERGEFTLTGSDRPADVATSAGQQDIFGVREPDSPTYNGCCETDHFGDPIPAATRRAARARPERAGVRGNVQPAQALPDTEVPPGRYSVRPVVGSEIRRELGATGITSQQEAAHVPYREPRYETLRVFHAPWCSPGGPTSTTVGSSSSTTASARTRRFPITMTVGCCWMHGERAHAAFHEPSKPDH